MAAEFLPGNQITLLNSGSEYFPSLLADIEAATSEIYLESYIYADDEIGHAVTGALCHAAARGVRVHVLVDGFGARNFEQDFMPRLLAAGVHVMAYRRGIRALSPASPPPAPPASQTGGHRWPRRLRRRHQHRR